jgi:hypothetical protein
VSRYAKASSARSILTTGRRAPLAFLGALVLAISVGLGAATAIADTAPTVTIDSPPTAISYRSAHVSGTVNPQGGPSTTSWHFEYSTDPVGGSWESSSVSGEISGAEAEGTTPIAVGGELEGLAPGTTYSVRLVAENGEGANKVVTVAPYPTLTTKVVTPPSVLIDTPTAVTATTAHFSGEINPEGTDATSDVFWYFECTPTCPTLDPAVGSIPADTSDHQLSVQATHLEPNTAYEVRLYTENAGGPTTTGPVPMTTETAPPRATTIPAYALGGGRRVLLGGRIDPESEPTTYWFEYGPDDSYGTSVPAGQNGDAGSAGTESVFSQEVGGLAPETVYHYRVVAENDTGKTEGQDQIFTTGSLPSALPQDCANGAIRTQQGAEALSDCRAWEQASPTDKNNNNAGFTNSVPNPGQSSRDGNAIAYFSNGAFAHSQSNQTGNAYISRRDADGWSTEALLAPLTATSAFGNRGSVDSFISADLSQVLVKGNAQLTPSAFPNTYNTYIRTTAGSYTLVSAGSVAPTYADPTYPETVAVTPDFRHILFSSAFALTPDSLSGVSNLYKWDAADPDTIRLVGYLSGGELNPEGAGAGSTGNTEHAISDDGSRIFYTAWGQGLYVREGGASTLISRSGTYKTATPSGSQVLMTEITESPFSSDLVRYDVASGNKTNLSPDEDPSDGSNSGVSNVVGASDDLSRVYFLAYGQLVPGQRRSEQGQSLYLSENGDVRYIASVNGLEMLGAGSAAASGDGQFLAFVSSLRLTGYDNDDRSEVYLYDAETEEVSCVSCNQTGQPASGDARLSGGLVGSNGLQSASLQKPQEYFADGGRRLYFQTTESLVGDDTNGVNDIYQWKDGQVTLISSGKVDSDSFFMGASASGDDVYFSTVSQLVAQDRDALSDVYDARVGGGVPAQNATSTISSCEGEQCRGSAAPPLAGAPQPSEEVRGSRNATPEKKHKKKHQKKKHKKKHQKKKHKTHRGSHRAQANG